MENLILEVGGRLTALHDDQTTTTDVSDSAPTLLFEPCQLASKVTLRDVFLLISKHIDVFETLLGNWCREFTEEILSAKDFEPTAEIQHLELVFFLEDYEGTLYGMCRPDFHGVGKDSEKYSIVLTPSYQLADFPVLLGGVVTEQGDVYRAPFTLGQILHGILWELAFFGSPKSRDEKAEELIKASDLFRSSTPIDLDDFFSDEEQ
jgi:hypothetical protein